MSANRFINTVIWKSEQRSDKYELFLVPFRSYVQQYSWEGKSLSPDLELLFRPRALRDIPKANVRKGDWGGLVTRNSLSEVGDCWVHEGAAAVQEAHVLGDAQVMEQAVVYGQALINGSATIGGDAQVCGFARVDGNATVCDEASIYETAWITQNAKVYGSALVHQGATIYGSAEVSGFADVGGLVRVAGSAVVKGNVFVERNIDMTDRDVVEWIGPLDERRLALPEGFRSRRSFGEHIQYPPLGLPKRPSEIRPIRPSEIRPIACPTI